MKAFYREQLKQIREQGHRITPQRHLILDALVNHDGHATAMEMYDAISGSAPSINKATIYRVLEFFCEMQLATKTEMGGCTYYEIAGEEPHHHLICTACGNVELLADHHFTDLAVHLAREHGFKANLNHLAIPGVCRNCQ